MLQIQNNTKNFLIIDKNIETFKQNKYYLATWNQKWYEQVNIVIKPTDRKQTESSKY